MTMTGPELIRFLKFGAKKGNKLLLVAHDLQTTSIVRDVLENNIRRRTQVVMPQETSPDFLPTIHKFTAVVLVLEGSFAHSILRTKFPFMTLRWVPHIESLDAVLSPPAKREEEDA